MERHADDTKDPLVETGFAHHRGVLDAEEIRRWRAMAVERCGEQGEGFHTDLERTDAGDRSRNEELLGPLWDQVIPAVLPEHRVFMSSFLVKWPGPGSDLYVHQDSTYVDESRSRSCAVWVALDDADDDLDNGPLRVMPGSHRWCDEFRGTGTEPWFTDCREELFDALVPVPVRAGDVVVMDNRLIHASAPNRSERPRVAVAGASVPVGVDLRHAVALGDGLVGLLHVDDAFYQERSPQGLIADPPDGPFFRVEPQRRRLPDPATVRAAVGADLPVHELDGDDDGAATDSRPPDATGTGRVLAGVLGWNHRRIERVSRTGPLHEADELPWLLDLEAAWPAVRAEWDELVDRGFRPLPMELVSGAEFGADGAWDAVVLRHNGGWVDRNTDRFPRTVEVLRRLPGLRAALFSSLSPGARIPPHRGANNGVLRAHLGVVVPGPLGACHLDVGRARVSWEEGRAFGFDDSYVHGAVNDTDADRIVLMIEVDRPLEGWVRRHNELVQRAFTVHPQVRGATARIEEVDAAANPHLVGA
ncbi:MAG: aspartyl/asparaginyl beta-hydroxylase domain-containing protein [Actinomycetota bacterium]